MRVSTARAEGPEGAGRGQAVKAPTPLYWYALREAADILDVSPEALRRQFERRSQKAADGVEEARIDGVRARKFGNRWRVSFGKAWTE